MTFKLLSTNKQFEPLYCPDNRRWSHSDYILWVAVNTDCKLGCKHCHEHKTQGNKWITPQDLEWIVEDIRTNEGRSTIKVHITPTLGDILLSPHLFDILDWVRRNNHVINICSYFPRQVDCAIVEDILEDYSSSTCLCCSLHGYTDEQREMQFQNPIEIAELLPLLNRQRTYLNTIYIFSNIKPTGNLLKALNPDNLKLTLLSWIDYKHDTVFVTEPQIQYKNMKHFIPSAEVLELVNGRQFSFQYAEMTGETIEVEER